MGQLSIPLEIYTQNLQTKPKQSNEQLLFLRAIFPHENILQKPDFMSPSL